MLQELLKAVEGSIGATRKRALPSPPMLMLHVSDPFGTPGKMLVGDGAGLCKTGVGLQVSEDMLSGTRDVR